MADLRSSNDSFEEISSSQERSNKSQAQPAGDEYEEEKVPRQDDVPKDMPVRMEANKDIKRTESRQLDGNNKGD
jgi:hypothetical protein